MNETKGTFQYDKDTRRMHRFNITTDEGQTTVTGTIYIPKDAGGIPQRIVLVNANRLTVSDPVVDTP